MIYIGNLFVNIFIIICGILVHEAGHVFILKHYKISYKLKTKIISTYVEFNEEDINRIANKKLFWSAGSITTILWGLIWIFLFYIDEHMGIEIKYGIYYLCMGILNMILIVPGLDAYNFFDLDKFIKWNDNNLHWKGAWILIGKIISFVLGIFVIWKILF